MIIIYKVYEKYLSQREKDRHRLDDDDVSAFPRSDILNLSRTKHQPCDNKNGPEEEAEKGNLFPNHLDKWTTRKDETTLKQLARNLLFIVLWFAIERCRSQKKFCVYLLNSEAPRIEVFIFVLFFARIESLFFTAHPHVTMVKRFPRIPSPWNFVVSMMKTLTIFSVLCFFIFLFRWQIH